MRFTLANFWVLYYSIYSQGVTLLPISGNICEEKRKRTVNLRWAVCGPCNFAKMVAFAFQNT